MNTSENPNYTQDFDAFCAQHNFTMVDVLKNGETQLVTGSEPLAYRFALKKSQHLKDRMRWQMQQTIGNGYPVVGLMVGDAVFADASIKDIPDSYIALDQIETSQVGIGWAPYFATAMGAVQKVPFAGEQIVDFGSGSGAISLYMLKKGAHSALLADNHATSIQRAKRNRVRNGFGNRMNIISGDIRTVFRERGAFHETIGVANIGPHKIYGGEQGVHMSVPTIVQELFPELHTMIIGGYSEPDYTISPILEQYAAIGFTPELDCSIIHSRAHAVFHASVLKRRP